MQAPPESPAPQWPVVLDTNAVLDWQLFHDERAPCLWRALEQGHLRWHATPEMLGELDAVLSRPLGARWTDGRGRTLSRSLPWVALSTPPDRTDPRLRCTDPDDQKFLDLALHLPARWLITRDRALLELRQQAATRGLAILLPEHWPGV